jgi:DNA-binding protein HU-beta
MNKEEIIEIIAAEHGIPKTKANEIIRTFLRTVQDAVVRGDKVRLAGFGIFEARLGKPRAGHNPHTSETVEIGEKRRPKFTAGRTFRAAVAGEHTADDGDGE